MAGEPDNADQLKAQTVDFTTFDEIEDTVKKENIDMDAFIQKTLEMSKTATDEEWRP